MKLFFLMMNDDDDDDDDDDNGYLYPSTSVILYVNQDYGFEIMQSNCP